MNERKWQQLSHSRVKHIVVSDGEYPLYLTKTFCGISTYRTMFDAIEGTRPCRKCTERLAAS